MKTQNPDCYRLNFTNASAVTYGYSSESLQSCSFGFEPLEHATPEDIERYRGRSALNELERVLFILSAQTRFNRR
jgi:hypothetical protein